MTREPVYAALFSLLSNIAPFVTTSRKLMHWDDVSIGAQPALFMAQRGETAQITRGQPTRWLLEVDIYIYVKTAGATAPAQLINPLLDAITAALAPSVSPDYTQTLGGLAHHCWIEGRIETDEGTLGDQAVAIIPIRILIT